MMNKIGRNDDCHCGSGKKYKKCCMEEDQRRAANEIRVPEEVLNRLQDGIVGKNTLDNVGQILTQSKGKRMRRVGDRVYPRPRAETFHEFLVYLLEATVGRDWWSAQLALPKDNQHFMVECSSHFSAWQKKRATPNNKTNNTWAAVPDGRSKALLLLAHDIYAILRTVHLPKLLLSQLKIMEKYRGARYEIAIASMFAQLGCEIEFLNDGQQSEKHCEFIAKYKQNGAEIAVGASHRQAGIYEQASKNEKKLLKGDILSLLNQALKQGPAEKPFMIFIDLNSPLTPRTDFDEKPLVKDIKGTIDTFNSLSEDGSCNGVFITNYSHHYMTEQEAEPEKYLAVLPKEAGIPLPSPDFLDSLLKGLDGHGTVADLE